MLPLSGPDATGYRAPLTWAAQNVNAAGGIDGRRIELIFRDIGREPVLGVARSVADDGTIAAAIGPDNSQDALEVASLFTASQKVLVTPSATSADLVRAFSTRRPVYFRQTVSSDIAQVRVLLRLAARRGARRVALLAGADPYGTTFFDWVGFLALEEGLRVTSTARYNQATQRCAPYVDRALGTKPNALIAVPDGVKQATCMARAWRARKGRTQLLFSDSAQTPELIHELGAGANGLEGTAPAPVPGNGFTEAFQARFGYPPTPYAANAYDAVLVIAYGLERAHGDGGAPLARGISSVLAGRGRRVGWDRRAVALTLAAIRAGRRPRLEGASGALRPELDAPMEPAIASYEHWRVEDGRFRAIGYLSAQDYPDQDPTSKHQELAVGGRYRPGPKKGLWALLVAASDGWENYRHQADVMAQYRVLRANGVPVSHIIVVMADDLARNKRNPHRGQVPYLPGGTSLSRGLHVDYPLHGMTAERLMAILSGHRSAQNPKVINSTAGDDVYVYLAGHGNADGLYLGLGEPVPTPSGEYSVLTPELLDKTISKMAARHRYRRMLVGVEACEGAALGTKLSAPGALLVSAASPTENSLSANYDVAYGTWLADEFSFRLWKAEMQSPHASLDEIIKRLYLSVDGSHVSTYGPRFGNPARVSLDEFLTP